MELGQSSHQEKRFSMISAVEAEVEAPDDIMFYMEEEEEEEEEGDKEGRKVASKSGRRTALYEDEENALIH